MTFRLRVAAFFLGAAVTAPVLASDFPKLNQSVPTAVDAVSIAPVFDFDGDGCLPSAGISRGGDKNGGLRPRGSLTGDCRSANFLDTSNTLHRYACATSGGNAYCGHFYALYFEKDQTVANIESGHRHDWEYAAVWTTNGVVTHGSYSAHGKLTTAAASTLPFQNGHLKIVYHKDGLITHALRFARADELAENPYGTFVTPAITSWYELAGDGLNNNLVMRTLLNTHDYGSASIPMTDGRFLNNLNTYKPAEYPAFTEADALAANPGANVQFTQLVNYASGLCMDIDNAVMANGTNVMQWACNGGNWQKWYLEPSTQLIRSLRDPRFCLDNGGYFASGANIMIWTCNGGNNQRFVNHGAGYIGLLMAPQQVIDGVGTQQGGNVGTWSNWGLSFNHEVQQRS
jgi:hypothetical protein